MSGARVQVTLTDEERSVLERSVLERWARRPKSSQALALRCRIVLAAADGQASKDIAARLGCNASTVGKWRGRFARQGLDGLHDEPRPGQPRKITDDGPAATPGPVDETSTNASRSLGWWPPLGLSACTSATTNGGVVGTILPRRGHSR